VSTAGERGGGRERHRRVAAVCPLVCVLLFSACTGSKSAETTVEFWALGSEGEHVAALLPDFERAHPGVRVRLQQIPWSAAHEKLLTAFVGEVMPDVFQAGNTWLPELAALGALAPLDASIDASTAVRRDDYFPAALAAVTIAETTWALPWYVDTRLLFYRSDILRAAGYGQPLRSWEQWRQALEGVRRAAGPEAHAVLLPANEWEAPVILALQNGATLLRDGGRRGAFREDAFRVAFDFYLGLFRDGLATPPGAQVVNPYDEFARGAFTFYLSGPWNVGEFRRRLPAELQDDWSTAALPAREASDAPGVSLAGGASLAIFRDSPRRQAAWQLIEFLSAPRRQEELQRLTGDLPARRSAWATLRGDPALAAFWSQMQRAQPLPQVAEWERIAQALARHSEAAIRGMVSPDRALVELDAEVDALLEKRRWLLAQGRLEQPATGAPQ